MYVALRAPASRVARRLLLDSPVTAAPHAPMPPLAHPTLRIALAVSCLALTSVVQGCQRSDDGGATADDRRRARFQAQLAQSATEQLRRGAVASGIRTDSIVPETAKGWIVKGTDFLTFWPCGRSGYYYMRAIPPVFARVSQEYKFASPAAYTPMFGELRLRYVDDTITVGERHFSRYAEVIGYTSRSREDATCRPPRRTTLSDEMERLDRFKVEVLKR
ncbi:MAG: hypothetical protein AMXMBFR55_09080 [Gemmatimonadota bacterium]